ncbi:MAG: hypothetical protein WAL98_12595 [Desulfatiglandaceae bacterium]|jgi:hypothetical protein
MSETKNTNTKNQPPDGKEIGKDKISSREMPEQERIETPQATAEIEKGKGFLGEVAENIGEGARMAGEKATELTDIMVDKLNVGFSHAYEAGAKVVDDLSRAAQKYVEKYKAESEIRKLKGEKDELMTQLGQSILKHHLAGGRFAESFFNKEEIIDQFNQIEMLDKKIIEIGKQLDKEKE